MGYRSRRNAGGCRAIPHSPNHMLLDPGPRDIQSVDHCPSLGLCSTRLRPGRKGMRGWRGAVDGGTTLFPRACGTGSPGGRCPRGPQDRTGGRLHDGPRLEPVKYRGGPCRPRDGSPLWLNLSSTVAGAVRLVRIRTRCAARPAKQMVQVHRNEGIAVHIGPMSCAGGREIAREASERKPAATRNLGARN